MQVLPLLPPGVLQQFFWEGNAGNEHAGGLPGLQERAHSHFEATVHLPSAAVSWESREGGSGSDPAGSDGVDDDGHSVEHEIIIIHLLGDVFVGLGSVGPALLARSLLQGYLVQAGNRDKGSGLDESGHPDVCFPGHGDGDQRRADQRGPQGHYLIIHFNLFIHGRTRPRLLGQLLHRVPRLPRPLPAPGRVPR